MSFLPSVRVLSGPKNLGGGGGGGGNREGRAGVIIVKQELCVFNCLRNKYFMITFCKNLGGKQNLLWRKHTLLASMQINPCFYNISMPCPLSETNLYCNIMGWCIRECPLFTLLLYSICNRWWFSVTVNVYISLPLSCYRTWRGSEVTSSRPRSRRVVRRPPWPPWRKSWLTLRRLTDDPVAPDQPTKSPRNSCRSEYIHVCVFIVKKLVFLLSFNCRFL